MASRIPRGRRRRTTRHASIPLSGKPIPQTPEIDCTHADIITQADIIVMDDHEPPRPCKVVMILRIDSWTRQVLGWNYDLIQLDSCEGPDHVF